MFQSKGKSGGNPSQWERRTSEKNNSEPSEQVRMLLGWLWTVGGCRMRNWNIRDFMINWILEWGKGMSQSLFYNLGLVNGYFLECILSLLIKVSDPWGQGLVPSHWLSPVQNSPRAGCSEWLATSSLRARSYLKFCVCYFLPSEFAQFTETIPKQNF